MCAILHLCLHPSFLPHTFLLSHSFFAPLGHWRLATSQWHYSTDCSASSSNMQCSLCDVKSVPAVLHFPLPLPLIHSVLKRAGCLRGFFTVWLSVVLGFDCAMHLLLFVTKAQKCDKEIIWHYEVLVAAVSKMPLKAPSPKLCVCVWWGNGQWHTECWALSRNYKWMHLITSISFRDGVHLQVCFQSALSKSVCV